MVKVKKKSNKLRQNKVKKKGVKDFLRKFYLKNKGLSWLLLGVFVVTILQISLIFLMSNSDLFSGDLLVTGAAVGGAEVCLEDIPQFEAIADQSINHSVLFTYQVNASDNDDINLTFEDNSSIFELEIFNETTALMNFTASVSHYGNHTVLIRAYDNSSDCPQTGSVSFDLEILNNVPSFDTNISNQTWEEDVTLTDLDLDDYFSDPDGDELIYTAFGNSNIQISVSGDGVVTFDPDPDWNGVEEVYFVGNDTVDFVLSNNITLTVTEVAETESSGGGRDSDNYCGENCGDGATEEVDEEEIDGEVGEDEQEEVVAEESDGGEIDESIDVEIFDECEPDWVCTVWEPDFCPVEEIQTRTCYDQNSCGIDRDLSLERECEFEGSKVAAQASAIFSQGKEAITLFYKSSKDFLGFGLVDGAQKTMRLFLLISSFVFFMLLMLLFWNRRKEEKGFVVEDKTNFSDFGVKDNFLLKQ